MIYLDNAASAPVEPCALAELVRVMSYTCGNPGSSHREGLKADMVLREARAYLAQFFSCRSDQVVFTSGGSEGNSTVIRGVLPLLKLQDRRQLMISAAEHESVFKAAGWAADHGFDLVILPVNRDGCVAPHVLESAISGRTGLVCIQYVNNELGGVNDVRELGSICRKAGALFHVDCVQAAGAFPMKDVCGLSGSADFASVSGHKMGAPRGIGALYVRNTNLLEPLIFGGNEQEFGLRGGTENVPSAAALGAVCRAVAPLLEHNMQIISEIKQGFYQQLTARLKLLGIEDAVIVNGPPVVQPGRILSLRFPGVDASTLIMALDREGICVSAGSACQSHDVRPSHVLLASGLSEDEARSTVRVSFSCHNDEADAIAAANAMANWVSRLLDMR